MDSLTQITLGASVAVAIADRKAGHLRAACWGGALGTLPDLDALIDLGDPMVNMIRHRAESHAIFYLSLASPLLAWVIGRLDRCGMSWRQWLPMVWMVLMTHIAIDFLTIYGTQLARPFSDTPFGMGSVFIIDPLYTIPLLIGLITACRCATETGRRWNAAGLIVSAGYLGAGILIQQHVTHVAQRAMPPHAESGQLLVTAAPLNTVLWRLIVITPEHYYEGWYSLRDSAPRIAWDQHPRGAELIDRYQDHPAVQRIARFSKDFFSMHERDGRIFITDLRLGLEPAYAFRFDITDSLYPASPDDPLPPLLRRQRPELANGLPWLWERMLGHTEQSYWRHSRATIP